MEGLVRRVPATVAIAHRQEVFRRGLEAMLDAVPGVVARAYETIDDLVADAIETGWARVSLVSVEVLRAGRDTGRLAPSAVVVTVPSTEAAHVAAAAQVGADGYVLLADLSVESLELALREVAAGRRYVPERIAPMLERWERAGSPRAGARRRDVLSPRESQVVELLVHGHSNKEISRLLGISIHSTKRHVSSILGKLDSPSRSHLVSSVLRGVVTLQEA